MVSAVGVPAFQFTTEELRKLVPMTMIWKPGPAAAIVDGIRPFAVEIVGELGAVTVKGTVLETSGPGLVTLRKTVVAAVIRLAGTTAVSCVALI